MPGCGKSTLGVLLAKSLGLMFLDTDLVMQKKFGLLQDIIDHCGIASFRAHEEEAILSVSACNTVIATGGSAVYSARAMTHLKRNGTVLYLHAALPEIERHLSDFSHRGIAMEHGMTIADLYAERHPLYCRFADLTVDLRGDSLPENLGGILTALSSFQG